MYTAYIETIDFGSVPIRKTFTDGAHMKDIELSSCEDRASFAEVRRDYTTNQPFAVLFDENWEQIT